MKDFKHDKLISDALGLEEYELRLAYDNGESLQRMKEAVPKAMEELTTKQKKYMTMYYFEKKTMPMIAEECNVDISTVSRTIKKHGNG